MLALKLRNGNYVKVKVGNKYHIYIKQVNSNLRRATINNDMATNIVNGATFVIFDRLSA